jgi:hypothetical protein
VSRKSNMFCEFAREGVRSNTDVVFVCVCACEKLHQSAGNVYHRHSKLHAARNVTLDSLVAMNVVNYINAN